MRGLFYSVLYYSCVTHEHVYTDIKISTNRKTITVYDRLHIWLTGKWSSLISGLNMVPKWLGSAGANNNCCISLDMCTGCSQQHMPWRFWNASIKSNWEWVMGNVTSLKTMWTQKSQLLKRLHYHEDNSEPCLVIHDPPMILGGLTEKWGDRVLASYNSWP